MKKLHVVLLFALLVVSSLLVVSLFVKQAEAGKDHKMICEAVGSISQPIERCENDEVICYKLINNSLSCFKK